MLAPPLLVSFSSTDDYISALSQETREMFGEEIRELVKKNLPPIVSTRCLSVLFGYSTRFVGDMERRNKKYYREFTIRQGSKKRKIQAPRVAIKVIQKWFGHHLSKTVEAPEHVYGYVPGRSAVDAAAQHCGALWVYSVDIENFFPSIKTHLVQAEMIKLGYSPKGASMISSLCCFGDSLAQGSPSSPVISNLVMRDIDVQLENMARKLGVRLSRYADDIVFSGCGVFPEELKELVSDAFDRTCWKLSPEKEYFADINKGQRLKVHGVLVDGDQPRLTKGYRNKIRAYKHLIKNNKVSERDVNRIMGHINFSDFVDSRRL